MVTHVFRPQSVNKRFAIKYMRNTGHGVSEFNWRSRALWVREGDRHRIHLIRMFHNLHYLGSHAPGPIRKRWYNTEQRFINHRIPTNASLRYMNGVTGARWL